MEFQALQPQCPDTFDLAAVIGIAGMQSAEADEFVRMAGNHRCDIIVYRFNLRRFGRRRKHHAAVDLHAAHAGKKIVHFAGAVPSETVIRFQCRDHLYRYVMRKNVGVHVKIVHLFR
ncbi:hypothetical protein SDC9_172402 [bioreactor metagenome]|uniref:Uncharacterized protein n=1 Tax=bioreactor metagenome TaxID=1076179 RepID=A0A645GE91_9ZZZZ